MTDEIIKALELCGDENNCTKCPYRYKRFEPDISCAEEMMRSAAKQMKRLKAENERLEFSNVHWNDWEIKCRAMSDFAERLKKECILISDRIDRATMLIVIDALLAELTEHKQTVSLIDGHIDE